MAAVILVIAVRLQLMHIEIRDAGIDVLDALSPEELEQIDGVNRRNHAKFIVMRRKMIASAIPGVFTLLTAMIALLGALASIEALVMVFLVTTVAAMVATLVRLVMAGYRTNRAGARGPRRKSSASS